MVHHVCVLSWLQTPYVCMYLPSIYSLPPLSSSSLPASITWLLSVSCPGHNWGSDHDPINENPCNPSLDNGGKFLMYQSVNDGTLRNNNKFSLCSQASVQAVLIAKSSSCFERMGMPLLIIKALWIQVHCHNICTCTCSCLRS